MTNTQGRAAKTEFKKEKNIVARQITYISKIDKIKGYYIFSYSSLKDNEETSNLYSGNAKLIGIIDYLNL